MPTTPETSANMSSRFCVIFRDTTGQIHTIGEHATEAEADGHMREYAVNHGWKLGSRVNGDKYVRNKDEFLFVEELP